MMIIRLETPEDYDCIYRFVKTAFETAAVSDGDEQDFVDRIRAGGNYLPELSFVAEQDGQIIGHIMLSRTAVKNGGMTFLCLLLAPLSVAEKFRNAGVGSALVRHAVAAAKEMGYTAVFLAGDRNYYGRFGFAPASGYGIRCDLDVPEELQDNIMALEIVPGALEGICGVVNLL